MLCRIEMPSNEQIFGRFYRYKLTHNIGGSRMSLLVIAVLMVMAAVFLFLTTGGFVLPAVVLVAMLVYFYYLLYMRPASMFRAKPGAALQTEVTVFTDSGFNRSVRSEEGGLPETVSMQYGTLYRAVETGQDFYLFYSPGEAYLVEKQYFTKGTPEELRAALQEALGPKFKGK